jgi:protein-disulfide isomerase
MRLIGPLAYLSLLGALFACASGTPRSADVATEPTRSERSSGIVQGATPPLVIDRNSPIVVPVDLRRSRGDAKATVAIVEFGDYQCPYCRGFHVGVLTKLHESYIETGKVRYFYRDFPLPMHEHALGAAVAAQCAGAQGRYWEMQELLYAEQARLGTELYQELATELNLEIDRFNECLKSDAPRRAVNRDIADGRRVGVNATPTFILGYLEQDRVVIKRIAAGVPTFEIFAKELDALAR